MVEVAPLVNIRALLLERDDIDAGVVSQLRSGLGESSRQFAALKEAFEVLEGRLEQKKGDPEKLQLKLGIAGFFLGKCDRAAELLAELKTPLARFYHGRCLVELGRYDDAIHALDAAAKAGYAASDVQLNKTAALRGKGKFAEAKQILETLDKYVQGSAEFNYQMGHILLFEGQLKPAASCFEKAVEVDSRHAGALFQLAYLNDRHGNDEEAIALYERCLQSPPVRVGTLVNLGILYEDHARYDKAASCFEEVLRFQPNNPRARLYLKDAQASCVQNYDEDARRTSERYNAVLDTPITDFELSVRARNCLKKMNIRSLGDLTNCTEPQLLASKNFGETSLAEIKIMLQAKGLRLGMTLEQTARRAHAPINPEEYSPQEQALFNKPVSELGLSVRARKCMARLQIVTIGDLIAHTSDELLECKNFGVTSLVEVKDKLAAISLKLRGD